MHRLSVVIPSKNGGDRLFRLIPAILQVLSGSVTEIIVVDDGGSDDNYRILTRLASTCRKISIVRLPTNVGQQLATMAGILRSRGEWIVTMDDDGHPVHVLPRMIRAAELGADLVYGYPVYPAFRPFRYAGTLANNVLFFLFLKKPLGNRVTSFRLIRGALVRSSLLMRVRYPYLSAMLLSSSPAVRTVRYRAESAVGSRYSAGVLVRVFVSLVLYWGPLRAIGTQVRRPRSVSEFLSDRGIGVGA